jgi:hypothetical protein
VIILLSTCLVYNFVLFSWSSNHDFALVPFAIPLSVLGGALVYRLPHYKVALLIMILAGIGQYYYINRPGSTSQNGMPYGEYKKTGEQISKLAQPHERIYGNTSYYIYAYYAKRNITAAGSYEHARQLARSDKVKDAIWVRIEELNDKIMITEVRKIITTE